MRLPPETYAVIALYIVFALVVGVVFARRAGRDVESFFLSGRSLPWWMAGTSMVATTFASDTPLVITGWVREHGIYQNWMWWCLAGGGLLTAFLFARYWRRGGVVTSAELAELRYGGGEARVLRFVQGVFQAGITNTIIMCWVILAAAKILDVLFEVDKGLALTIACTLALSYSMLAGFWGVVVTDLVQFAMAMVGAVALAFFAWDGIGGAQGLADNAGALGPNTLALFPPAGEGAGIFDARFWTAPLATVCVFLGVQWWATDQVDGGGLAVQRISAARTERDGMIGTLWFNIAHYALRPWPWILVALASLIVLPRLDVSAPIAGQVTAITSEAVTIAPSDGSAARVVALTHVDATDDWAPTAMQVQVAATVEAGDILARTDPERAYVVMALRYLGDHGWLLGLVIASLLAAFMSTIDTHVNLAASFFVNDLYRRFFKKDASDRHYVWAGRFASAGALALAGVLALASDSISHLFTFFMAFLSGVGPVYILRWLWWRVRAGTEIVAMVTSSIAATWLTFDEQIVGVLGFLEPLAAYDWSWLGSLADGSEPGVAGRLVLVVLFSGSLSLTSLLLMRRPDPRTLVDFYRRVRPVGCWGPVRKFCPEVRPPHEARAIFVGWLAGLAAVYGVLFALGGLLLERSTGFIALWTTIAAIGALGVTWSLRNLRDSTDLGDDIFVSE